VTRDLHAEPRLADAPVPVSVTSRCRATKSATSRVSVSRSISSELDAGRFVGAVAGRRRAVGFFRDLLIQVDGFRLGPRIELALERIHTELVLAQCRLPATQPRIERHDGAVHGLLERVQREKAKTGLDGLFVSAACC
jgi:hypothetical protein